MSTYYISKSCVWIIVTGGHKEYNRSNNTYVSVTGCNVTVIIELGMIIISCDVFCKHNNTSHDDTNDL